MKAVLQKAFGTIVNKKNQPLGEHLIAEFWGVKIEEDMEKIEKILTEAASFTPRVFSRDLVGRKSHSFALLA